MLSLRFKILGKCKEIRKILVGLNEIKESPEPERIPGEPEHLYKLRQLDHSVDTYTATFIASPFCYPREERQDLNDYVTRARKSCLGKLDLLLLDLTEYYKFIGECNVRKERGYNF